MAKSSGGQRGNQTRVTLSDLMRRAQKLRSTVQEYEATEDHDGAESELISRRYERAAMSLLDDVAPLLETMAECRLLEATYVPDLGNVAETEELGDADNTAHLAFLAHAGRRSDSTTFEIYSPRLTSLSDPHPPLIRGEDEDFGPFHPAVYIRVPVVGHVVLEEAWHHDDDDIRVIHSRPILADPSNVEFVSQSFDIIEVQPMSIPTVAVYGTLDPETDLRDYSWNIEELGADDVIVLLGYDFEGSGIDWARRLSRAREEHKTSEEEDTGVYLRGEYRKLPKLDVPRPDGAEPGPDEVGQDDENNG